MARSVDTIFNELVAQKEATTELSTLTSTSRTAIWRLILYVVAYALCVHEKLWDAYKTEVTETVESEKPHTTRWYRDKALAFMENKTLVTDEDYYDTSSMTEAQIEAAQVVKYAACNENATTSVLNIKIAGENSSGARAPISTAQLTQFTAYMNRVKDAGVRFVIKNQTADEYKCTVRIMYDPAKTPSVVQSECIDVIKEYIENLPFNGVYSDMELTDLLQAVDGVKIVGAVNSQSKPSGAAGYTAIQDWCQPVAGYMQYVSATVTMEAYNL